MEKGHAIPHTISKVDLRKAQQLISDTPLDNLPIDILQQIKRELPTHSSKRLLATNHRPDDFTNTLKCILKSISRNPGNVYRQEVQLLEAIKSTPDYKEWCRREKLGRPHTVPDPLLPCYTCFDWKDPIHFSSSTLRSISRFPSLYFLPSDLRTCIPCMSAAGKYLPGTPCSPNFCTCLSCNRLSCARLKPCPIRHYRSLAHFSHEELSAFYQQCKATDQQVNGELLIKSDQLRWVALKNAGQLKRNAWLRCSPPRKLREREPDHLVDSLIDWPLSDLYSPLGEVLEELKSMPWVRCSSRCWQAPDRFEDLMYEELQLARQMRAA